MGSRNGGRPELLDFAKWRTKRVKFKKHNLTRLCDHKWVEIIFVVNWHDTNEVNGIDGMCRDI